MIFCLGSWGCEGRKAGGSLGRGVGLDWFFLFCGSFVLSVLSLRKWSSSGASSNFSSMHYS